jgi:hypothetical protein
MKFIGKSYLIVSLIFALIPTAPQLVSAQDTHYWNHHYGPRSMLLSGAVVGSIFDMSATYYNPGILGYIEEPELLLSANVYQASSLTIENGAGRGLDLETSDFNPLPNMLAGAFRWKWLGANKLAYSFLTRYRFSAEVRGARVDRVDVLPGSPGEEDFAGGLSHGVDINELWAGLTWARGLGKKIGFGITQYLSVRTERSKSELFAQALDASGEVALAYDILTYSSDVYGFLWKAGVGLDFWPVTVGLTLTTPNVTVHGTGYAILNETRIGVDADGDGSPDETFETSVQENLAANYNSPLSVGAGAALHFRRAKIHASAEWFDAVESYDVLELDRYTSQGTGQVLTPLLRHKSASVLNWAVGMEITGDKYDGYLSFNADYSAFDPESDIAVTGFDIYHVTGGTNVKFGKTEFMLGVSFATGNEKIPQVIDLNPQTDGSVIDPEDQVKIVYQRYTLMLGFSVKL